MIGKVFTWFVNFLLIFLCEFVCIRSYIFLFSLRYRLNQTNTNTYSYTSVL